MKGTDAGLGYLAAPEAWLDNAHFHGFADQSAPCRRSTGHQSVAWRIWFSRTSMVRPLPQATSRANAVHPILVDMETRQRMARRAALAFRAGATPSARRGCKWRSLVAEWRQACWSCRRIKQMLITKLNLGLEVTASAPYAVKLALLGTLGGTHIGGSFARGAAKLGIESIWFDADKASTGSRLLRSLSWHLADRRPLHLNRFSNELVKACARAKPEILIATGMAPLTELALRALRQLDIVSVNYSTDDPWNPAMRSELAPAGIAFV